MNKAHIELLKNEYDKICDEYLLAFCSNYDRRYTKDAWVSGAGSIACIGDYYFDFKDVVKYCVDNNLTDFNEVVEWYDYSIDVASFGLDIPSFKDWHEGCPHLSNEQLDSLCEKRKELEDLVEQYKKNLDNTGGF